ncbi:hypothetical protein HUW46_06902 [Amycolatopsis sp. CA-230715]|nr:hypothetical protein HUW46_06902 [Amycolatopsis sp. CA-230715]
MVYNLVTAVLMALMFNAGVVLVDPATVPGRRIPWGAVALTVVAIAGVVLQLAWSGAMDALDNDPAKSGWWRPLTSVFLQNGGVAGAVYNLVTLAVLAALAEWFWGTPVLLASFAGGMFLPGLIGKLFASTDVSAEARNFAGSSGATYFLAATLAGALVVCAGERKHRVLAVAVPVLGLATWFAQDNAHGLVAVYGFLLGVPVWFVRRGLLRPGRTPKITVGSLVGKR